MPQREFNSERIKKRQGTKKKEAKNEQPNVEISSEDAEREIWIV